MLPPLTVGRVKFRVYCLIQEMLRRIIAKSPLCPHTIADDVQKIPTTPFFPWWVMGSTQR